MEEATLNLFSRYEQRLLSGTNSQTQAIPAVVITGFLGSGKTTLVQHILRNRGSLRIAVLVNEVGQVDLDSSLLNAKQSNAAVGVPAADLSGGCVCCTKADDLKASLQSIAASSAPDYLVVETSGASDASPLASLLLGQGFRLDAVVAVVDAEAGADALKLPVAEAQVRAADVVVVNKCDLAGLGTIAELEDALRLLAPGARLLRARFGEVPLPAVLDVEPIEEATAAAAVAALGAAGGPAPAPSVLGAVAFMSHEAAPVASSSAVAYRVGGHAAGHASSGDLVVGPGNRRLQRQAERTGAAPSAAAGAGAAAGWHGRSSASGTSSSAAQQAPHHPGHGHSHDHHDHHNHPDQSPDAAAAAAAAAVLSHQHHAALHGGFHTVAVAAEQPCSLVAFARFARCRLMREPGLYRCKGILWLQERRANRFVFHLSGRRRVEFLQEGCWEGPPYTQLVLIGSDPAALVALRGELLGLMADCAAGSTSTSSGGGGGRSSIPLYGQPLVPYTPVHDPTLIEVARLMGAHERLQLLLPSASPAVTNGSSTAVPGGGRGEHAASASPPPPAAVAPAAAGHYGNNNSAGGGATPAAAAAMHVLEFSAAGSPLHGINGEELNAEIMRRANGGGDLVLVGVTSPGVVSAVTRAHMRDRVVSLLLPASGPEPYDAPALPRPDTDGGGGSSSSGASWWMWRALCAAADPVLRKAYQHVTGCKCDVVIAAGGAVQGMAR